MQLSRASEEKKWVQRGGGCLDRNDKNFRGIDEGHRGWEGKREVKIPQYGDTLVPSIQGNRDMIRGRKVERATGKRGNSMRQKSKTGRRM